MLNLELAKSFCVETHVKIVMLTIKIRIGEQYTKNIRKIGELLIKGAMRNTYKVHI